MKTRILLLDDDPLMLRATTRALESEGIEVEGYENVDDFMRAARKRDHDAILIDWCLRKCEGTDVCVQLRSEGDERPIGLISSKLDAEHGRDIAEAAGANCYIDKSAPESNLADEIRTLVRSAEKRQRRVLTEKTFRCRTLAQDAVITLKLHGGHVTLSNVVVRLRPKEMEVFEALLDRSGQVVSKADLARVVWGSRAPLRTSIVETWICRLRTALGPAASVIETAPGGYRIAQD